MCKEVVVGFDNIYDLFDKPLKETDDEGNEIKTVNKYDVVTTAAYMIGVDDEHLEKRYGEAYREKFDELRKNREATIIRNLNRLRTTLMLNFKKTDDEIFYNLKNIDRIDYYDQNAIQQLKRFGIPVVQPNIRADKYSEHFSKLINENIDACKGLFPEWIKFDYIKDLFVIQKYNNPAVMKAEFAKYQEHLNDYPFQMYINWDPDGKGNIINSDGRFIQAVYAQHNDYFNDRSKYIDATDYTKESIYDFVKRSHHVDIVVDCENSDVYKLYGVLKNLDEDELEKIAKIILYDDYHTSCGWDWLEKFIKIPVEHIEVERVTDRKSLVDIKMTAGVCREFYTGNTESFILCSSDSDFWGLVESLPDAEFLVMYEYEKCGQAIKDALATRNIYHCSMDDFYTGNADDLKKRVLINTLKGKANMVIGVNGMELTKEIYESCKITAPIREMEQFYNKYVKTLRLKIGEDGVFKVEVTE